MPLFAGLFVSEMLWKPVLDPRGDEPGTNIQKSIIDSLDRSCASEIVERMRFCLRSSIAAGFFAASLANASILGAIIVPLAAAYYICKAMAGEAGIHKSFRQATSSCGYTPR